MIPTGTKYRALPDGWFVAGSIVEVIEDCAECGVLMSGRRLSQSAENEGKPIGHVYDDEELCSWDEFEVIA